MKKHVIITAGGVGKRMGAEKPKQFLELGGTTVLMQTMQKFADALPDAAITLTLPEDHYELWLDLCRRYEFNVPYYYVKGGNSRFESVKHALSAISGSGLVAVHDGVRPFVSRKLIRKLFEAAEKYGAAIPVIPPSDSLRKVEKDGSSEAVNRNDYRCVQTPQVFDLEKLKKAYSSASQMLNYSDDASVYEDSNESVHLVEGESSNFKITRQGDYQIADFMIKRMKKTDKN